jgi:hypothetical protein
VKRKLLKPDTAAMQAAATDPVAANAGPTRNAKLSILRFALVLLGVVLQRCHSDFCSGTCR